MLEESQLYVHQKMLLVLYGTDLDVLVIENFILYKDQNPNLQENYKEKYNLD